MTGTQFAIVWICVGLGALAVIVRISRRRRTAEVPWTPFTALAEAGVCAGHAPQACDCLPKPAPARRYWATRPAIGWHEHEITEREYVRLEHEAGHRNDLRANAKPVTRWLHIRGAVSAWTTVDGDRGDAPTRLMHPTSAGWLDGPPTRDPQEVQADLRAATGTDQDRTYLAARAAEIEQLGPIVAPHRPVDDMPPPVVHAHTTRYLPEGIEHACSGCGKPWPCASQRVNGSAL